MKLKKLHIKNFKNLKDITIDFESGNGLTMLIGNNGSGKSNVLEAISGIFHDAYKENKQRKLASHGVEYDLRYTLSDHKILIRRKNDILRFYVDGHHKGRDVFTHNYMPKNVIGMYSGEEDRLWTSYYEPYYKAYMRSITYGGYMRHMKLMFINKNYWNIALLTLLLSQNPTLDTFIKDDLKIRTVDRITINYSIDHYTCSENELLKSFIDRINPDHEPSKAYSLEGLRELVFSNGVLTNENGNGILFGDTRIIAGSGLSDQEFFNNCMQAYMPSNNKLISSIEIEFNEGITTLQLSEGEKKLVLVKTILEIIADEKTLLLFDEPDANLHEGRKNTLYNMMLEYPNRQIVLATHSPTFVDIAEQEQIKLIKSNENGDAYIYSEDKIEAIRSLTGSRFNAFLEKPVLFCEGTTSSVEAELYPVLFPDYKVIPSGGHEEVIRNVKAYNTVFADDMHRAIGVIDWDYKSEAQLNALRESGIYSLKVVEIENVLMDLLLLNAAKEQFCADEDSIEKVKQCLFTDCKRNAEKQAKKYTANRIVSNIKSQISADGRTIEDFKENVSRICNSTEIDALYNERLAALAQMVRESEYENITSIYDFNHHIDHFVNDISNDYQNKILRLIKRRDDLQENIIRKYYSDIPLVE